MSAELLYELRQLRQEFAHPAAVHSPWIGMDEMQKRYDCTGKTLLAMERRKEIPERVNGRWFTLMPPPKTWQTGFKPI